MSSRKELEEAAADAELYIGIFALVDVSDPAQAEVKEILWRKAADGIDVKPTYLIYSATTRHCIFVGVEAKGESLYSVQQGKTGPARPLGSGGLRPEDHRPRVFAGRPVPSLFRPRPSPEAEGPRTQGLRPIS